MKVIVLGQWGAYPEADGATSGYLFQSQGFNLLVDCGSAVISKMQKHIRIDELDAVLLSHYHHDHVADIGPLQYGQIVNRHLGKIDKPLSIFSHTFDMEGFNRLTKKPDTVGVAYDPQSTLKIGPFSITFLKTKHPAVCFAMRITDGEQTVVYSADSSYIKDFTSFSVNADLFICECSFYANQDGSSAGHMNSKEAAKIAKDANVSQLLLSHLPHFGDHQQLLNEAKEEFEGKIELAKADWTWG